MLNKVSEEELSSKVFHKKEMAVAFLGKSSC